MAERPSSANRTTVVDAFGVTVPIKSTEVTAGTEEVEAFGVRLSTERSSSPNIAIGVFIILIFAICIVLLIPQEVTCTSCGGDGQISSSYYDQYGYLHATMDCPVCGGTGVVIHNYGFLLWFLIPVLFIIIGALASSGKW